MGYQSDGPMGHLDVVSVGEGVGVDGGGNLILLKELSSAHLAS